MALSNLKVTLSMVADQYLATIKQAQREADQFKSKFQPLSKTLTDVGGAMQSAGLKITAGITAPLVGLGAFAVKTGIHFESAFAGVRKTVNATEPEFARLREQFRQMAKEVPIAATEFARIGEAAGQLGIKKENIAEFSRVMADLGVTTNLSSDQAAQSLARLANITQMPQDRFRELGNIIVHLGNNMATTEAEIVEFGLRIAGAGKQIGLTEGQILGFGAALSSVGINAEAGGTAISKVFIEIANSVASGGDSLAQFASVSGMSVAQFRQAFEQDAAGATIAFVEGLGRISESGGNVFGVLEQMGLSEIRLRDALLRASGAGDLLRNSIELQSEAIRDNNALNKEAEQRYKTTASQLVILKNQLVDIGITLFDSIQPVLQGTVIPLLKTTAAGVASLADWFSKLPGPVKTAAIGFAAVAAAVGPATFGIGLFLSSIGGAIPVVAKLIGFIGTTSGTGLVGVITKAGLSFTALKASMAAIGIAALPIIVVMGKIALVFGALYLAKQISDWIGLTDALKKSAISAWEGVKVWIDLGKAFFNLGKAVAGIAWDWFIEKIKSLVNIARQFWETLRAFTPQFLINLGTSIGNVFSKASTFADSAKASVIDFTSEVNQAAERINTQRWFEGLKPAAESSAGSVAALRTELFGAFRETENWFNSLQPKTKSSAATMAEFRTELFAVGSTAKSTAPNITAVGNASENAAASAEKAAAAAQQYRDQMAALSHFLRGAEGNLEAPFNRVNAAMSLLDTNIGIVTPKLRAMTGPAISDLEKYDIVLRSNAAFSKKAAEEEAGLFAARQRDAEASIKQADKWRQAWATALGNISSQFADNVLDTFLGGQRKERIKGIEQQIADIRNKQQREQVESARDAEEEILKHKIKITKAGTKAHMNAEKALAEFQARIRKEDESIREASQNEELRQLEAQLAKEKNLYRKFAVSVLGIFQELGKSILKIFITDIFGHIAKSFAALISPITSKIGGLFGKIPGIGGTAVSSAAGTGGSIGGRVAGTSGGIGGSLTSGFISGGIAAAGSIVAGFMSRGREQRTEENTRETRDWLELFTVNAIPKLDGIYDSNYGIWDSLNKFAPHLLPSMEFWGQRLEAAINGSAITPQRASDESRSGGNTFNVAFNFQASNNGGQMTELKAREHIAAMQTWLENNTRGFAESVARAARNNESGLVTT